MLRMGDRETLAELAGCKGYVKPSNACPNCGARPAVQQPGLPVVACLACGWGCEPGNTTAS